MRRALVAAAWSILPVAQVSPQATAPAECSVELLPSAHLQKLYPPGSRRRHETGVVTIELTIEVTSRSPLEVALLESSGHEDLDGAALEIGKRMRVETDCLRSTVKRAIHFEKEPDPPRSSGTSDYILTGETHIWVEEL